MRIPVTGTEVLISPKAKGGTRYRASRLNGTVAPKPRTNREQRTQAERSIWKGVQVLVFLAGASEQEGERARSRELGSL